MSSNPRGDHYFAPDDKIPVKVEAVSFEEEVEELGEHNHLEMFLESDRGMRKSLSMSDITVLKEELKKKKEELMNLGCGNHKEDNYHRYSRTPQSASHVLAKTKFVRQKPRAHKGPSGLTIPLSPMLRCKTRSRPLRHVMSLKEKEELEIKEMKKFKLKANGIPKSVILGPINLPDVQKKPLTVPAPFNLTEMPPKLISKTPEPVPVFKAKPAPVNILRDAQVPPKLPAQITVPVTPNLLKRTKSLRIKPVEKPKPADGHLRLGPIKPIPFSFDKRDEESKKKHDQWIEQQREEDRKKATAFKAQPLPEATKKRTCSATTKSSSSTTSENKENFTKFEAKPPVVLHKEPFKPVRHHDKVVPKPFNLNLMKRAAEREKFDQQIKVKEKEMEQIKEQQEKERLKVEEEAVAELRKKMVHHAKPISSGVQNPFVPQESKIPLTVPETPKFARKHK